MPANGRELIGKDPAYSTPRHARPVSRRHGARTRKRPQARAGCPGVPIGPSCPCGSLPNNITVVVVVRFEAEGKAVRSQPHFRPAIVPQTSMCVSVARLLPRQKILALGRNPLVAALLAALRTTGGGGPRLFESWQLTPPGDTPPGSKGPPPMHRHLVRVNFGSRGPAGRAGPRRGRRPGFSAGLPEGRVGNASASLALADNVADYKNHNGFVFRSAVNRAHVYVHRSIQPPNYLYGRGGRRDLRQRSALGGAMNGPDLADHPRRRRRRRSSAK